MLDPLPMFLAALATMPVGFLWYSPALFAKPWLAMSKIPAGKMKKGPGIFPFVVSLFSGFVMAFLIGMLMVLIGIDTLQGAWKLGLLLWFGFDFVPGWMRHLFDRRPLGLFLINTGHMAANVLVIGWVLTMWR